MSLAMVDKSEKKEKKDKEDKERTGIRVDYKIEHVLGKGSFATVRKGKHRASGERVAVKIISKRKLSEEDKVQLQNEIEIMKQIDHPNIVKLAAVAEDEKYMYIVMELLQGGELFDQICKKETFSEKESRDIIAPIFDALIYCHKMGIVHRDVKPENLLLTSKDLQTGIIKVSDFGLARFLQGDKMATTTCGTPGYVAPEIISEKPYKGEPCDFWSCGVVLFILLSGEPPFFHEDNFELFEMIKKCDYSFENPIWKQISPEAKDLIQKLLTADPEKRITAKEIQAHPWITGQIQEKPISVLEKMRGWDTKRKLEQLNRNVKSQKKRMGEDEHPDISTDD